MMDLRLAPVELNRTIPKNESKELTRKILANTVWFTFPSPMTIASCRIIPVALPWALIVEAVALKRAWYLHQYQKH